MLKFENAALLMSNVSKKCRWNGSVDTDQTAPLGAVWDLSVRKHRIITLTPNLELFMNLLKPFLFRLNFCLVSKQKYGKTATFSGWEHFYS